MRFLSLAVLPLLALVSATSKHNAKGSPALIIQTVSEITSQIESIKTTLSTFTRPKDVKTALRIKKQSDDLNDTVLKAANYARTSAPFTEDESYNVVVSVLDLQPVIYSLLDALVAKKPVFDATLHGGGATRIARKTLVESREAAASLSAQLTPKFTADWQEPAPIIAKNLDDRFVQAIAAFS